MKNEYEINMKKYTDRPEGRQKAWAVKELAKRLKNSKWLK